MSSFTTKSSSALEIKFACTKVLLKNVSVVMQTTRVSERFNTFYPLVYCFKVR